MQIQRKKILLNEEKAILTGSIISEQFMKEMYDILKDNYFYFKSAPIKTVLGWVLEFYKEFQVPPYSTIQDIFNAKSDEVVKEESLEILEDLLLDISDKYEESSEDYNADYNIKLAINYCKKISLLNLSSEIKGLVESNNIQRAELLAGTYNRVESIVTDGISVDSEETDAMRDKLYSPDSSVGVVEFDGAFGEMWGRIEKGSLHLIVASAKNGKSLLCNDLAKICVMKGLKVGYFSFEMNAAKVLERFDANISKCSLYRNRGEAYGDDEYTSKKESYEKIVNVPYFAENNELKFKQEKVEPITADKAKRANRLFKKQYRKGKLMYYDLVSSGATVDGIIATIDLEERYSGRPFDLLIIDSVYLMSGGVGKSETERIGNLHWSVKQRIGEAKGIPVLTPFQFNRGALSTNNPDEKDLASSYAVMMHTSSALFLRASQEEMACNLMRVFMKGRDGSASSEIVITRALGMCRGLIDSRYKKDIPNYDEIVKGGSPEMTSEDEEELSAMSLEDV